MTATTKILIGFIFFLGTLGLGHYSSLTQADVPSLVVTDPNSPTVVRVEGVKSLFGPIEWECTISVDGRRPTQLTGWPKSLVCSDAAPKALIWHSNPDWVEIALTSGLSLKLTWDRKAEKEARASRETHYYLSPKFEVLKES